MSIEKKIDHFIKKITARPTAREILFSHKKKSKRNLFQIFLRELIYIINMSQLVGKSSQITYTFILSIVPFLSIVFTFVHLFHGFDNIFETTLHPLIKQHFGHSAGNEIALYLQKIIQNIEVKALGIISFLTFSLTSVLLLFSIEDIFNEILQIKNKKSILQRLPKCGLLITIFPFLFFLTAVKSEPLWHMVQVHHVKTMLDSFILVCRFVLELFFQAAFFAFLYYILPSKRLKIVSLVMGAVVAGILFELLQYLNIYLASSALSTDPHKIYGTAPLIAILFFGWIRLSWLITFLGAACGLAYERVFFLRKRINFSLVGSRVHSGQ